MSKELKIKIARIFSFIFVVGLSLYIYIIRDQAVKYALLGIPGVFLISFLAYATVLLPAPGIAVVFTMGSVYPPLSVAIAAGIGAALGELVGYLAGFSTQGIIEKSDLYQKLSYWMGKNGPLTIMIISIIPNPFFDFAGLIAGALKMPVWKFFLCCCVGEIIKMLIIAYTGFTLLDPP